MGKRGPKPTPKAILRLRGSWRGKETSVDLDVDHKLPQRPKWLKGEAKDTWDRLVPELFKQGLATELNVETLALMCSSWADYVEAEMMLDSTRNENGTRALLINTSGGGVMENPLLYTRNRAFGQFCKMAACFGLTPADMAGVTKVPLPAKTDSKAKFFKGT